MRKSAMLIFRGVCLLALASAGMVNAQDTAPAVLVGAPKLGHFYDSGRRQLQSLVGIPGSGFPGTVVDAGAGSPLIEPAPSQDYALLLLPDTGQLAVMRLDVGTPAALPVTGTVAGITNIAFSPGSSEAVVYSAGTHVAQVITGLPENPLAGRKLDWTGLPGRVTALAIDDTADRILAAAQNGDSAVLYAIGMDGAVSGIYNAQTISSLAFFRNSREAVAAAPGDGQVIWVRDVGGVPSAAVLANASAGLSAPRFVEASQDAARALVVDSAGGVFAIPLAGGAPVSTVCHCQPTQLRRMRGRDVFLLTSAAPGLAFLDAGGDALSVVIMPEARGQVSPVGGKQ